MSMRMIIRMVCMGKSKTELLSVINSYTVHFAEEKIDRPEAGSSKTNKYMPLAIAFRPKLAILGNFMK